MKTRTISFLIGAIMAQVGSATPTQARGARQAPIRGQTVPVPTIRKFDVAHLDESEISRLLSLADTVRVFMLSSGSPSNIGTRNEVEGHAVGWWMGVNAGDSDLIRQLFARALPDSIPASQLIAPSYAMTFDLSGGRAVAYFAPTAGKIQVRRGTRTWTSPMAERETNLFWSLVASNSGIRTRP